MESFGLGSDFAVLEGVLVVLPQEGPSMSAEGAVRVDVFLADAGVGGEISIGVRECSVAFSMEGLRKARISGLTAGFHRGWSRSHDLNPR